MSEARVFWLDSDERTLSAVVSSDAEPLSVWAGCPSCGESREINRIAWQDGFFWCRPRMDGHVPDATVIKHRIPDVAYRIAADGRSLETWRHGQREKMAQGEERST